MIKLSHTGMMARIMKYVDFFEPFPVTQGCVLIPTLLRVLFAAMLLYAFENFDIGVCIRFRMGTKIFNLHRFKVKTKELEELAMEF